jgi:hypothetical protein
LEHLFNRDVPNTEHRIRIKCLPTLGQRNAHPRVADAAQRAREPARQLALEPSRFKGSTDRSLNLGPGGSIHNLTLA